MTLVILSVLVIALLVAVLAIYLFTIGMVLNRTAGNLDDCLPIMRTVVGHASAIGPGVKRINEAGTGLTEAMPLLVDDAEKVAALSAPATATPSTAAGSAASPPDSSTATEQDPMTPAPDTPRPGVGYLDE